MIGVANPRCAFSCGPLFANFGFERTLEIHGSSVDLGQTSLEGAAYDVSHAPIATKFRKAKRDDAICHEAT